MVAELNLESVRVKIRPAVMADVPGIQRVADLAWSSTFADRFSPELIAEVLANYYSWARLADDVQKAAAFLVAEADEIVGYCHFRWSSSSASQVAPAKQLVSANQRALELSRLYLLPAWQGHGIGRELFQKGLERAGGACAVTLTVEKGNWRARRFYEKLGFKPVGERIWTLGTGSIELVEYILL